MQRLLALAHGIDSITGAIARVVRWGLPLNALLITGNAIARKIFSVAWASAFDLQWHFFAAVVVLMAAYTFQRDQHVRVDVLAHRLGERALAWLDLIGIAVVLLPVCAAMVWVSWPQFIEAFLAGHTRATRESMSDIPAWIIKGFIPLGFALLALQGVAEAIRCAAHLAGLVRRPTHRHPLFEGSESG